MEWLLMENFDLCVTFLFSFFSFVDGTCSGGGGGGSSSRRTCIMSIWKIREDKATCKD